MANPITIGGIAKTDSESLRVDISAAIAQGCKLLADYKRPKVEVIPLLADLILARYSDFCMDDVRLVIQNLVSGQYGELIALDAERIGRACEVYREQKRQTAIHVKPEKRFSNGVPMPDYMREKLKSLAKVKTVGIVQEVDQKEVDEFVHGKPEKKIKKGKPLQASEVEQDAFKFWDAMRMKAGDESLTINYDGKNYSQTEWLKHYCMVISKNPESLKSLYEWITGKPY